MSVRLERGAVDTSWERDNPYVSRASDSSLTNIAPCRERWKTEWLAWSPFSLDPPIDTSPQIVKRSASMLGSTIPPTAERRGNAATSMVLPWFETSWFETSWFETSWFETSPISTGKYFD
jgi:hypothetical protein